MVFARIFAGTLSLKGRRGFGWGRARRGRGVFPDVWGRSRDRAESEARAPGHASALAGPPRDGRRPSLPPRPASPTGNPGGAGPVDRLLQGVAEGRARTRSQAPRGRVGGSFPRAVRATDRASDRRPLRWGARRIDAQGRSDVATNLRAARREPAAGACAGGIQTRMRCAVVADIVREEWSTVQLKLSWTRFVCVK